MLVSSLIRIIKKATSQHVGTLDWFSSSLLTTNENQKFPLHEHTAYPDPADLYNKPIIALCLPEENTQATWATYGKPGAGPRSGRSPAGAGEENNNSSMRTRAPTSKQTYMCTCHECHGD